MLLVDDVREFLRKWQETTGKSGVEVDVVGHGLYAR